MATVTTPSRVVDLPAPQPPRYNLLATATVVTDDDPHWGQGVVARGYPLGVNAVGWSYEVGSVVAQKPDHESDRQLTGKAFSVVWSYGCTRAGLDTDDLRTRALQVFAAIEPKVVEEQLWSNPLGVDGPALDTDNDPGGGDSLTMLNGGTAVKPILAFALLEQFAAESSLPPTIHARPAVVALLGGMYETAGPNTIQTKLGTPIVSGAGYPGTGRDGAALSAQQEWAYVSGPVVIRRDTVDVLESFDRSVNDYALIVERQYLVVFDWGLQAGVKIDKALA
jgi:hypothetical protein